MAIQRFDEGPGFGALLGSGVGSGISSGLKAIEEERKEKRKQRDLFKLLKTGGYPDNIAAAVAGAPAGLQRGLLWNLSQNMDLGSQQGMQQPQQGMQQPLQQQQSPLQQIQQMQQQEQASMGQGAPERKGFWGLGQQDKGLDVLRLFKGTESPEEQKNLMSQLTEMGIGEASQEQQQDPQRFWGLQQQPSAPKEQRERAWERQRDLNSLKRVRMQLLKKADSPKTKKKLMKQLTKMGLGETEIGVLIGTELTDDIIKFFLENAGGNPKAAEKLAKAFGYGG